MNATGETIRHQGSRSAFRFRIAILTTVLAVALLAGISLVRGGGASSVAPAWPAVDARGPGHVPRVWVDQP